MAVAEVPRKSLQADMSVWTAHANSICLSKPVESVGLMKGAFFVSHLKASHCTANVISSTGVSEPASTYSVSADFKSLGFVFFAEKREGGDEEGTG